MSTFGKKSLVWWDYHTRDKASLMRFNCTPKELQLQILEKWYPIGMIVGLGDGKFQHEIVEYVEHLTFWNLKLTWKVEGSLMNNTNSIKNPLAIYPSPYSEKQIKRQYKLDELL